MVTEHMQPHMGLQTHLGFDPQLQTTIPHYTRPRPGRTHMFVDAAYKDGRAAVGCIVEDEQFGIKLVATKCFEALSALEAELRAF